MRRTITGPAIALALAVTAVASCQWISPSSSDAEAPGERDSKGYDNASTSGVPDQRKSTDTDETAESAHPAAAEPDAEDTGLPGLQPHAQPQPIAAGRQLTVPERWSGVGVLERSPYRLPKRAPRWARIQAEVIDKEDGRYLIGTGTVRRIDNPALAKSTAEARARAVLARWLGADEGESGSEGEAIRLIESRITAYWRDERSKISVARAEILLPEDWSAATGGTAE